MHPTVAVTGEYDADSALSRSFEIVNKRGLHARASAKFVQLVDSYDAHVRVSKDGMTVGGTSIMGLMMLAASPVAVLMSAHPANRLTPCSMRFRHLLPISSVRNAESRGIPLLLNQLI